MNPSQGLLIEGIEAVSELYADRLRAMAAENPRCRGNEEYWKLVCIAMRMFNHGDRQQAFLSKTVSATGGCAWCTCLHPPHTRTCACSMLGHTHNP